MKYISLYTMPAYKDSLNIFDEYGYYFFSDEKNGKFNIDEIKKSTHIGLGEEFECESDENKDEYIKILKIGEKNNIDSFKIEYNETSFEIEESEYKKAFLLFLHGFAFNEGKINIKTPKKYFYIKCNKSIIEINENTLYLSKKLSSFPLHTNNNLKYIKNIDLIDSYQIDKEVFFKPNKNLLLIKGEEKEISEIYSKILISIIMNKDNTYRILDEKDIIFKLLNTPSKESEKVVGYKQMKDTIHGFNQLLIRNKINLEIGLYSNGLTVYIKEGYLSDSLKEG